MISMTSESPWGRRSNLNPLIGASLANNPGAPISANMPDICADTPPTCGNPSRDLSAEKSQVRAISKRPGIGAKTRSEALTGS